MDDIDPNLDYQIEGRELLTLKRLEARLYTEDRMSGDEMRDWANWLNQCLKPIPLDPPTVVNQTPQHP